MAAEARLDVSIVLPTYNESASLPIVVPRIARALEESGLNGEIIVVDDDSPDGTADIARELSTRYPLRVERRTSERGLATAVLRGFAMSEAEVCVVMDADGSHPVEALGDMVRLILKDQAEIVVGSRHVRGGGSKDWPLFSRFKSRFAASMTLGLTSMTDPTTGFMAIRRSLLPSLALDPVGWKIVLEIVVKAHPARLAEVPIVFIDREVGESKQSVGVLAEYFKHLYKLYQFRFPAFVEFLKFCLVGVLGLFVDLSVVFALKELAQVDTRLCQVFGFLTAVSFNYAINRRYSFERAREAPILSSYLAYVGANLVGLTVRMVAIHALIHLTSLDTGRGYLLLSVIGIFLATMINFVGVKYFAFASPLSSDAEAARVSVGPTSAPTQTSPRAAWALLVVAFTCFFGASLLDAPRTHDEQVNMVMAHNIRASFEGFVHPAVSLDFSGDWQKEALPLLGNTPVYPSLLALASPLGRPGLAVLALLIFGLGIASIYASVSLLSRGAGRTAALLAASSPLLFAQYSIREFEPLVASLGALGFALLLRARESRGGLIAFFAGAALGAGFLVKMWLVLPAVAASFGLLAAWSYRLRPVELPRLRRVLLPLAFGMLLVASLHLMFVALVSPQDLGAWVEWVYFGLFSGHGATAPKLSAARFSDSSWAYLIWLFRDHGALFVPIVLGLPSVTRRVPAQQQAFFAAVAFAFLSLVPLSVPAAKEPLYMAALLPFLYAVAGLCLDGPGRTPTRYARYDRAAAKLSLLLAATLIGIWLWTALGLEGAARMPALLHLAHVAVWTVPSVMVLRNKTVAKVVAPCAAASVLVTVVWMLFATNGTLG